MKFVIVTVSTFLLFAVMPVFSQQAGMKEARSVSAEVRGVLAGDAAAIERYAPIVNNNIFLKVRPMRSVSTLRTNSPVERRAVSQPTPYLYLRGIVLDHERPHVFILDTKENKFIRLDMNETLAGCMLESASITEATFVSGGRTVVVAIGKPITLRSAYTTQPLQRDAIDDVGPEKTEAAGSGVSAAKNSLLDRLKQRRQKQIK